MYYVYIIRGPQSRLFVGITNKDLKLKMEEHRKGINSLKIKQPFSLIYASQITKLADAQQKKNFIKALFKAKCLTFRNIGELVGCGKLIN